MPETDEPEVLAENIYGSKLSKWRQPLAWLLVIVWAIGIFVMSAQPGSSLPAVPSEVMNFAHFCEYWVLAVLIVGALNMPWRTSWMVAVAAMVIASLFGITDEFHQMFVANRTPDVVDWLIDTSGGTVGSLAGTWALMIYRLYILPKRKY